MDDAILIVGGGEETDLTLIKSFENVACADSGYDTVKDFTHPLFIIGDFDSIKSKPADNIELIKYPVEKDMTDTELAIIEAIHRGYENIYITGIKGSRPDHFHAVTELLYKYRKKNIVLFTKRHSIFLMHKETDYKFDDMKGSELSLFAYSPSASQFTTQGLKYSLEGISLKRGCPVGVSNRISAKKALVNFRKGYVLCFVQS